MIEAFITYPYFHKMNELNYRKWELEHIYREWELEHIIKPRCRAFSLEKLNSELETIYEDRL